MNGIRKNVWLHLIEVLGPERVSQLSGVPVKDVTGIVEMNLPPPTVLAKIEFIVFLGRAAIRIHKRHEDADLLEWFNSPRPELEGRSVIETLSGKWEAKNGEVHLLRELADPNGELSESK